MVRLGLGDGLGAQELEGTGGGARDKCEVRKDAGDCPLIGVDRKRERATCIYPHGDQQAPFHCQLSMIRSDIAGDGY